MMRSRKLSLIGSALLGLLVPVSAAAYVTPDQLLFEDAFMNSFQPPPSTRQTDNRAQQQAETSAERRAREQAEYFAAQQPSSGDEQLYGAAGADPSADSSLTDAIRSLQESINNLQGTQNSGISTREQRILDRIAANQEEQLHSGAPLDGKGYYDGKGVVDGKGCIDGKGQYDGKGGCVIGSGAPLNESGPASWLMLGLVCAALWWTMRKAANVAAVAAAVPQARGTAEPFVIRER